MQIPTEFKGKVYFYWNTTGNGWLTTSHHPDLSDCGDYILLGSSDEIRIKFSADAATESAITQIEKAIEEERAASLHRINIMRGQIQSLRALEHVA